MIKIRIIKLPPEAEKLAKKFEEILATMVARTVKTMVGVDSDLKNLEITVSEELIKYGKGDPMKITKKYLQLINNEH